MTVLTVAEARAEADRAKGDLDFIDAEMKSLRDRKADMQAQHRLALHALHVAEQREGREAVCNATKTSS